MVVDFLAALWELSALRRAGQLAGITIKPMPLSDPESHLMKSPIVWNGKAWQYRMNGKSGRVYCPGERDCWKMLLKDVAP